MIQVFGIFQNLKYRHVWPYVFCYFIGKPMPDNTNITIGVTCTTEIEFSTTIIAYPEPLYELQ